MRTVAHLTSVHRHDDTRIFAKECASLASGGYDVVLVVRDPPSGRSNGVDFVRFESGGGRLRRIALSGRQMFSLAAELNADIYHVHDPELLPTALRLARRGAKVIYDAHELVRKDLQAKPYLPPGVRSIVGLAVGRFESFVAGNVAGVVAATPTIARVFDPNRTVVVANYPIIEEFATHKVTDLADYERRGQVASYVGGIRPDRGAFELIEAGRRLAGADIMINLAGHVDHMDVSDSPGITYRGQLQRTEVAQLLGESRIGLSVLRAHPNYLESLPTKVFEYMASGIPVVVSNSTKTMASIVQEVGCGVVLGSEQPDEIARSIRYLLANTTLAYEMGQRGLRAVQESFSWESQEPELLRFYERILSL